MNFSRNAAVSVSASALAALVAILISVLYVRILGFKVYGVIGFFAAVQGVLMLLDLGLTQVVSRVFSSQTAHPTLDESRAFRQFELVYLGYAILVSLGIYCLSGVIVKYWLRADDGFVSAIVTAMRVFGFTIGFRVLISFYQAVASGKQKLYMCALWNLILTFLLGFWVCFLAYRSSLSLYGVAVSTCVVAGIQCLIFRKIVQRKLEASSGNSVVLNLTDELRLSAHISLGALAGQIFAQLDRLVLVRILDAESFGIYAVAKVIAGSLYIFTTPFFQVFYAGLTKLLSSVGSEIGVEFYRRCTYIFSSLMSTLSVCMVLLVPELALYVFGDRVDSHVLVYPASILIVSVLVHSVMHIPYALQLAYGVTSVSIWTNLCLLVIGTPIIIYLAFNGGLVGAAFGVLLVFIIYAILNTYLTHRLIMLGTGWRWLTLDVCIPLAISFAIGFGFFLLLDRLQSSLWQKIPFVLVYFFINTSIVLLFSPHKRMLEFIKTNKWGA